MKLLTPDAPATKRRHKPKGITTGRDGRSFQRCELCSAVRGMWGTEPMTHWLLNNEVVKWCPGRQNEQA